MRYEKVPTFSVWLADSASVSSKGRVAAMAAAFQSGQAASTPLSLRTVDHKPVDDLLSLYEKAWSAMAKRNLLADLERQINGWMRTHPDHITLAWVALREVVTRLLETNSSAAKYTHAICAGWAVGCNYDAGTGHVSKFMKRNPDYFAHSPADKTDMLQKCADMAAAIRSAKSAISLKKLPDDERTLKIFMAPEFYFRGKNGAYSPDIVGEIIPRMQHLLGAGWGDWLFVFGTAVASIEDEVTYCTTCGFGNSKIAFERDPADRTKTVPKCSKDTGIGPAHLIETGTWGAEVQNVALIHHAGESYTIVKEYVSGIDYKNAQVVVQPGGPGERSLGVLSPQGSHASRIKSIFNDERMGGCILNIAGLTVGVEVCLDHITSAAPSLGRASRYAGTIQVLLIPSYGMEIGAGLYCRNNGVVFNVDGRGLGSSAVVRKGRTAPIKTRVAVNSGRGAVEIWSPVQLPS